MIPFHVIRDFLLNGKGREQGVFLPPDGELDEAITVLETGLSGKHLEDGAIDTEQLADEAVSGAKLKPGMFRLLPFVGVDGSGEEPELTCTLTGAREGDAVAAVIDTTDFSDARAKFASSIAADDEIEQVSLTDESTVTFLALLIAR